MLKEGGERLYKCTLIKLARTSEVEISFLVGKCSKWDVLWASARAKGLQRSSSTVHVATIVLAQTAGHHEENLMHKHTPHTWLATYEILFLGLASG